MMILGIWDVEEEEENIKIGFRQVCKTGVEGTSCSEGYSSAIGQNTWANR